MTSWKIVYHVCTISPGLNLVALRIAHNHTVFTNVSTVPLFSSTAQYYVSYIPALTQIIIKA